MLKEHELNELFCRLSIPKVGQRFVRDVRSGDPARRVNSSSRNTSARYASRKMGVSIQAESVSVELRFIMLHEFDDETLEYWDQPGQIILRYRPTNGIRHTPDFLVIRQDSIRLVECKPAEKLLEDSLKMPNRYVQGPTGTWRCPPGEEAAAELGLQYDVWTPEQCSPEFVRNLTLLSDYLIESCPTPDVERTHAIQLIVRDNPGITLDEVVGRLPNDLIDTLFYAIAHRQVYVDLNATPLAEPDVTRLYPHAVAAETATTIMATADPDSKITAHLEEVVIGIVVVWDDQPYRIINANETSVTLADANAPDETIELSNVQYQTLCQRNAIVVSEPGKTMNDDAWAILSYASPEALSIAHYRLACIEADSRNEPLPTQNGKIPSPRTLRRWRRNRSRAEQIHGYGFLGLIPRTHRQGHYGSHISEGMEKRMHDFITDHYENKTQPSAASVYRLFVAACQDDDISENQIPCFKSFNRRIKERRSPKQTREREGKKRAYQEIPTLYLRFDTPPHGDRPLEIVHIDHTQLDIELRFQSPAPYWVDRGSAWGLMPIPADSSPST